MIASSADRRALRRSRSKRTRGPPVLYGEGGGAGEERTSSADRIGRDHPKSQSNGNADLRRFMAKVGRRRWFLVYVDYQ